MVAAYFCKHGSDVPWCKRCEEIAQAREEGRRQGIEEAAREADREASHDEGAAEFEPREWKYQRRIRGEAARNVAYKIRALAAPKGEP